MSPEECQEAVRRIEQARTEGTWLLDLGDLPLDDLPQELGSLTQLRVLALGQMSARPGSDGVEWKYNRDRPRQRFSDLNVLRTLTRLEEVSFLDCVALTDVSPLA